MAPIPVPLSPRRLAASNLRLHSSEQAFREGSATIVLPKSSTAFLNPVQEFNRDLSVLAIRSWSEMMDEGLRKKWEERRRKMGQNGHNGKKGRKRGAANVEQDGQNREAGALAEAVSTEDAPQDVEPSSDASSKRIKLSNGQSSEAPTSALVEESSNIAGPSTTTTIPAVPAIDKYAYRPFRFTLLEALSATGLRSIRYAREIPLLDKVIANDLSTSAVKAMKRNVALNFPSDRPLEEWMPEVNVQAEQKIRKKELEKKAKGGQTLDEDELMELENARMAIKAANEAEKTSETDGQAADGQAEDVQATASTTAEAATTGPQSDANGLDVEAGEASHAAEAIHPDCKVQINEGDALDVMYSHRNPTKRFQVVDLDPYGTVAPFLDAAVQSVADGGLLCVTSTDCAVLASNNYPEKAFSLYGGSCTRVEYCHEIALRLVLHAISSSAAKYGRYIQPMLSLSIDFYVRLFVRVHTGPSEVKRVASKTGLVYTCSYCQDFHEQRMGRVTETESKNGNINYKFQNGTGPPGTIGAGSSCEECGSRFLIAGPMWLEPLHDVDFCNRILANVAKSPERSQTAARIRGMVGTAALELSQPLFYFIPAKIAGLLRAECPPMNNVVSALLHRGFQVSRSHCQPGSLKTNATRRQVFDVIRNWIEQGHPVKLEGIAESSPARQMVLKGKTEEFEVNVEGKEEHPKTKEVIHGGVSGGVRYQMNPTANWGPGTAAKG